VHRSHPKLDGAKDVFHRAAAQSHLEQLELAARRYKAAADIADANAVVVAEIGNGFEIRCQTSGEPHQFHIVLRFAFQSPTGLNAIEVAVNVEFEKQCGVITHVAGILPVTFTGTSATLVRNTHQPNESI
jgi:hypothetical protein